jgi:hypothetical protein
MGWSRASTLSLLKKLCHSISHKSNIVAVAPTPAAVDWNSGIMRSDSLAVDPSAMVGCGIGP